MSEPKPATYGDGICAGCFVMLIVAFIACLVTGGVVYWWGVHDHQTEAVRAGHAHWEPKENGKCIFRWNSLDSSMPTHRGGAEKLETEEGGPST